MLQEQALLQQQGINDPLEVEFSNVVQPIMDSCTKDSISVSTSMYTVQECPIVAFHVFASGWQELDFYAL